PTTQPPSLFIPRHQFTLHAPLPIEQCADNLNAIEFPTQGWFADIRSQTIEVRVQDDETLAFHVRRRRRNRSIHTTMAQAQGTLTDNGDGTTTLTGIHWMSYWYLLFLLFPAVIGVAGLISVMMGPAPIYAGSVQLVLLAGVSYGYWQIYRDRRDMLDDIAEALQAEKHKGDNTSY
ncbi:MAG: hypothetical protein AAF653_15765, partial [Chloroflexota bacterium]